ncbi:MAG: hypothetical protein JEZ01_03230 [Labilibaculum sp.]|nr:hypothetical protein [Labilibaculum sp.]MBI9056765.1 hypothetical protein [Labilibaculum sp.]
MKNFLKLMKALMLASLGLLLGLYLLKNVGVSEFPLLETIIGISNVLFWGALLFWVIIRTITNAIKN